MPIILNLLSRYWLHLLVVGMVAYAFKYTYDSGYQKSEDEWVLKWSNYQREIVDHQIAHEKQIRQLQSELQSAADRVNKDAKVQIDKLESDLLAANASAGSLRDKVTKYAASAKKCASNTGTTATSETADAPAVVLGRMFSWADQSAGELAEFADRSRIAGLACEAAYDELRKKLNSTPK